MANSLYEELGVSRDASPEELKKAYKKLALQHHPDKAGADKVSSDEKFKKMSEAYAVLSDDERRRLYDRTGSTDPNQHQQHQQGPNIPDIHEFMRNMFAGGGGGPFGGGGGGGRGGFPKPTTHQPPGIDVVNVVVTPAEIFRGLKKVFGIELNVECPDCSGRGAKNPSDVVDCHVCQGTGVMSQRHGPMEFTTTCPGCGGKCKGIAPGKGCGICRSSGSVKQRDEFAIDVPPGFQDRQEITIKGRGNKMREAQVRNDIKFVMEMRWPEQGGGDDSIVKAIRLVDNATGAVHAHVEVGLLDLLKGIQRSVDLYGTGDLAPILQFPDGYRNPIRTRTLKGHGLPRSGGKRGDLTISYAVSFPADESEEARELMALGSEFKDCR